METTSNHRSNGQAIPALTHRPPARAGVARHLRYYARRLTRQLLLAVRHWEARTSLTRRRRQVLRAGVVAGGLWLWGLISVLNAPPSSAGRPLQRILNSATGSPSDSARSATAYQSALRQRQHSVGVAPPAVLDSLRGGPPPPAPRQGNNQ